jgi:oxygen-dependent protoporphyrinogen oxidase
VAIVGAGIAGLAAAWELRHEADLTLFEPDRVGGCILTTPFEGHLVDEGPDAFITRAPEALELCRQAGIESELVAPAAGRALVWVGGRLRPIPDGLVLGVPRQLGALMRSKILSPAGMLRAAGDLVLPRGRPPATLTVRELVVSRFGAEVADRLVDPLVGGIHAGSTAALGAAEVTPMLVAAAEQSRSLLLGLRRAPAPTGAPVFAAPRHGVGQLVEAVEAGLRRSGARFVRERVTGVKEGAGRQVVVAPDPEPYDAAVITTSAPAAARLLGLEGSEDLASIRSASVVLATMAFDQDVSPAGYSGFLVARSEGRLMTACSFASNKWPQWADDGRPVLRLSAGKDGDRTALELDDARLVDRLVDELGEALGRAVSPSAVRISRWPHAFPQYLVGHGRRVARIEAAVRAALPTVGLAGAAYHGSGLPACIASGRRAARAVAVQVGAGPAAPDLAVRRSSGRSPEPAVSPQPEVP